MLSPGVQGQAVKSLQYPASQEPKPNQKSTNDLEASWERHLELPGSQVSCSLPQWGMPPLKQSPYPPHPLGNA